MIVHYIYNHNDCQRINRCVESTLTSWSSLSSSQGRRNIWGRGFVFKMSSDQGGIFCHINTVSERWQVLLFISARSFKCAFRCFESRSKLVCDWEHFFIGTYQVGEQEQKRKINDNRIERLLLWTTLWGRGKDEPASSFANFLQIHWWPSTFC